MMEVQIHTKRGFRMRFRSHGGNCAYVDLMWDGNKNDEVTFFVPMARADRYRRAVEAFNAVLADESIKEDVPAPEPYHVSDVRHNSDDDMVDF